MSHAAVLPVAETGELCLLLQLAAMRRSLSLLKQVLRSIAHTCPDQTAKQLLKRAKQFLSPQQCDWLEGSLRKLYEDPDNQQGRSPYSYLWARQGTEPLAKELTTRVSRAEAERLAQIARAKGVSRSALQREIVQRYLQEAADAIPA